MKGFYTREGNKYYEIVLYRTAICRENSVFCVVALSGALRQQFQPHCSPSQLTSPSVLVTATKLLVITAKATTKAFPTVWKFCILDKRAKIQT